MRDVLAAFAQSLKQARSQSVKNCNRLKVTNADEKKYLPKKGGSDE